MQRRKRVDPRVIGSFVVGAVILSVAGLLFFGPGGFLSETRSYVIYFDSSIKGLKVGSPVRFRGVKIGQVRDINVHVSPSDFEFSIPVVIEIEPSRIKAEGTRQGFIDAFKTSFQGNDPMRSLVDKGLRAQLQLDSLVTGQLYVNFDMHENAPLTLTGYVSDYPELPTITSSLDELTKTIEDLPLKELVGKLIHSAEGFEKLTNSPSLHNALSKFDNTVSQLNTLLENLNQQILPLVANLNRTMQQTRSTLNRIENRVDPLALSLEQTLAQARTTLSAIDGKIDPLSNEFTQALQTFEDTVLRAITPFSNSRISRPRTHNCCNSSAPPCNRSTGWHAKRAFWLGSWNGIHRS